MIVELLTIQQGEKKVNMRPVWERCQQNNMHARLPLYSGTFKLVSQIDNLKREIFI